MDTRDQIVDFVRRWSGKTEFGAGRVHWVARHHRQQVLRLAGTLREGERAQRLGFPRLHGKEHAAGQERRWRWRMRGRLLEGYVEHYNDVRLNPAIGYLTPKDMLAGRQQEILAERDRKLEEARKRRQIRRQQVR